MLVGTSIVHCASADRTRRALEILSARDERHVYVSSGVPNILIADLDVTEHERIAAFAEIEADAALGPFEDPNPPVSFPDEDDDTWKTATLHDVLERIHAPAAWPCSRGAGVIIGVVDSGIRSTTDFPLAKRVRGGICVGFDGNPWNDAHGHGSMVASIAAGSTALGGKFNGVAPDARLLACRTDYRTAHVFIVFDQLIRRIQDRQLPKPFVLNLSFGPEGTSPPPFERTSAHVQALRKLLDLGTLVVCAAGNNHDCRQAGFSPEADGPNTIWSLNSFDDVCCVGAVDWCDSNTRGIHARSSRGPGQWFKGNPKPDCVAPSYGQVLWGNAYRALKWWGTSGAAPQVAGLAALVWSRAPGLTREEVIQSILAGCRPLSPSAPHRVGQGVVDCEATLKALC